jgi:hypothetical protein
MALENITISVLCDNGDGPCNLYYLETGPSGEKVVIALKKENKGGKLCQQH